MLEKLKKNVHMSGGSSIEFPPTQMEMTNKINELIDVVNAMNESHIENRKPVSCDPLPEVSKPIRPKEEIIEEIYLKSGKREQAHQLLREYALSCVPQEDAHDNRRADTWNECREEMLKNINNQQ